MRHPTSGLSLANLAAQPLNRFSQEQKTVPLVNLAFPLVTPAIFVIFFVSQGLSNKTLVVLVTTQIRHFRRLRQKSFCLGGTKARFTKNIVLGTPIFKKLEKAAIPCWKGSPCHV